MTKTPARPHTGEARDMSVSEPQYLTKPKEVIKMRKLLALLCALFLISPVFHQATGQESKVEIPKEEVYEPGDIISVGDVPGVVEPTSNNDAVILYAEGSNNTVGSETAEVGSCITFPTLISTDYDGYLVLNCGVPNSIGWELVAELTVGPSSSMEVDCYQEDGEFVLHVKHDAAKAAIQNIRFSSESRREHCLVICYGPLQLSTTMYAGSDLYIEGTCCDGGYELMLTSGVRIPVGLEPEIVTVLYEGVELEGMNARKIPKVKSCKFRYDGRVEFFEYSSLLEELITCLELVTLYNDYPFEILSSGIEAKFDNVAPVCSILSPTAGTTYEVSLPINIQIQYSDEHSEVVEVRAYVMDPISQYVVEASDGDHLPLKAFAPGPCDCFAMVTDGAGNIGTASASFNVKNDEPRITSFGPANGQIGAILSLSTSSELIADCEDGNWGDCHTASIGWGNGSTTSGEVTKVNGLSQVFGTYTYDMTGVYTVTCTVTDITGASATSEFKYIVVYDPNDGFVTGGGWIDSPEGAYAADLTLTGKANFGFVSKYKKGATIPTGNTQFVFHVADLNFHSTKYDWLVIAGAKAMFKGSGTINNAGDYGFMLSAIDGQVSGGGGVDKFRIKIWEKADGDVVVYDNQTGAEENADPTTEIGGGSIVIHKSDSSAAPPMSLPQDTSALTPFPGPANPDVWIPYRLSSASQVVIRIHDMAGRLVRTLDLGPKPAGFYTDKSKAAYWDGKNEAGEQVASGIYFCTLQAGDFRATKKVVVAR